MYEVRFCKGNYIARQQSSNRDECVAYVEHHFNSTAGTGASSACVLVGSNMPAILVEPLFARNPQHAESICSDAGQQRLAQILADSIRRCFPNGGRVAFSVGHK
jgi:N-acetylmuramoyl-L-alanine amidase